MKIHLGQSNRGLIKVETENGCIIENVLCNPNINKQGKVRQDIIDGFMEAALYVSRLNNSELGTVNSILMTLDRSEKMILLESLIEEFLSLNQYQ